MPDTLRDRRGVLNRQFDSGESTVDMLSPKRNASAKLTLSWLDIPEWQKDNEYILTGYRR
jgi:hypothetical protein